MVCLLTRSACPWLITAPGSLLALAIYFQKIRRVNFEFGTEGACQQSIHCRFGGDPIATSLTRNRLLKTTSLTLARLPEQQLLTKICAGAAGVVRWLSGRRQPARWRAALRYLEPSRRPPSVMPDPVAFPARWWAHLSPVPQRMPPFPLRPRALAPVRLDCF